MLDLTQNVETLKIFEIEISDDTEGSLIFSRNFNPVHFRNDLRFADLFDVSKPALILCKWKLMEKVLWKFSGSQEIYNLQIDSPCAAKWSFCKEFLKCEIEQHKSGKL